MRIPFYKPDDPEKPTGNLWGLLMSHHPPEEYDHTYKVRGLRVCARCTGIIFGMVVGAVLLVSRFDSASLSVVWIGILLPLPAVIDFLAHETGDWRSNNEIRLFTGICLGLAVLFGLSAFIHGAVIWGAVIVFWLTFLEFFSALWLKKCGKLDAFAKKYESGVRNFKRT